LTLKLPECQNVGKSYFLESFRESSQRQRRNEPTRKKGSTYDPGRPTQALLRPAVATPIELYSDDRVAEFLLSDAVDQADYEAARQEVRAMV